MLLLPSRLRSRLLPAALTTSLMWMRMRMVVSHEGPGEAKWLAPWRHSDLPATAPWLC
jgi:hypothetical protein